MKRILALTLAVLFCLSLTACGGAIDLTQDLKPADFEPIVLVPVEDMLETLAMDAKDFETDIMDNGIHNSGRTVTVLGQEFDLTVQVWDGLAQDYYFTYGNGGDPAGREDLYDEIVSKMTELYGEPEEPQGQIDFGGQPIEMLTEKWIRNDKQFVVQWFASGVEDSTRWTLTVQVSPYVDPNDRALYVNNQ